MYNPIYDPIHDLNFDGKLDEFELAMKLVEEDRECAELFGGSNSVLHLDRETDLSDNDLDDLDEVDRLLDDTDIDVDIDSLDID